MRPLETDVEKPGGSRTKRRKTHMDPIVSDELLDISARTEERKWDMQRRLAEARRLCLGMFDGMNTSTPCLWRRSTPRAVTPERTVFPADLMRLTEHITKVTDVLCPSTVPISELVLKRLHHGGIDVPPNLCWIPTELDRQEARCVHPGRAQPCSAWDQHASAVDHCAGSWTSTPSAQSA